MEGEGALASEIAQGWQNAMYRGNNVWPAGATGEQHCLLREGAARSGRKWQGEFQRQVRAYDLSLGMNYYLHS